MTILLLRGYNNYFNRIKKSETTITAYKEASTSYLEYGNVNFDPKDGILTSLVVGSSGQLEQSDHILDFENNETPDYLIVHDNTNIASRWFVLESVKIRSGQYKLALKRDVLIDFGDVIMNSPCFIEKGWINDVNSPLLRNSEGMKFNQIKQSETFIKDDSHCAWLVGYVKKNIDASDLTNVNPINYNTPDAASNIPAAGSFSWEPCIEYFNIKGQSTSAAKKCFRFYNTDISFRYWYQPDYFAIFANNVRFKFTENFQKIYVSTDFPNEDWGKLNSCAFDGPEHGNLSDADAVAVCNKIFTLTRDDEDIRNKFQTMVDQGKYLMFGADTILVNEDVSKYNGKLIYKDGHVYRLEINPGKEAKQSFQFTGENNQAVSWMTSVANKVNNCSYNDDNPAKNKIQADYRGQSYIITAREIFLDETISFNFPVSSARNNCSDATYDMFCMPINPRALGLTTEDSDEVVISYTDGNDDVQIQDLAAISENQVAIAMSLMTKLGANSDASLCYDLQLLPYCPFEELNVYYENHIYGPTYGKWVIDTSTYSSYDFSFIYNSASPADVRGIIFYPRKANFSKFMEYSLPNESVHEEWQTMINPTLLAQGTEGGLTQYAIGFNDSEWPYEVEYDSVWEIGPNSNNPTAEDVEFSDGLTNEDLSSLTLYISGGLKKPVIFLTCSDFPTAPAGQEYSYTFTGEFTVRVKAKWIVPDRPEDVKLKNECDLYRLASPNFNSMYEFKKTKLLDGLKSFNIDCTYKPFSPYIKINPNYDNSFYAAQDFNDNMGLILSGDFSIPMLSDAWVNYELSNRNYQAIFNRQIENLDVNNQIAKEQQQYQAIMGTLTGGITGAAGGAVAGAKMGGPYGAIAGAVVGGVAGIAGGAVGGSLDAQWLARQQEENRSFAIDQFNYQLGNVQALNATITKSTPLTYNNKVWPILEYYTCTEEEKNVLRNKIKYDGMTIMAIGNLKGYVGEGARLKGQMIRLQNLGDDSHIAQAIYDEVNKGFYEGE